MENKLIDIQNTYINPNYITFIGPIKDITPLPSTTVPLPKDYKSTDRTYSFKICIGDKTETFVYTNKEEAELHRETLIKVLYSLGKIENFQYGK